MTLIALLLLGISFVMYDSYDRPVKLGIVGGGYVLAMIVAGVCRMNLDTVPEMLHYNIVMMSYYEPWDEYIHKTCSETTCTGSGENRSCTTTTYDCSYVDNHPATWEGVTNVGSTINISEGEYLSAVSAWKNKKFRDMHRDYHSYDGDAYDTYLPISEMNPLSTKLFGFSRKSQYQNKIVFNPSVFHYKTVSPEEKKIYELYDWSETSYMGGTGIAKMYLDNANYLYGADRQISLRMMIYKNKPIEAGFLQECLWNGGNKNEFNVAIGINPENNNSIDWVKVISWTTNERLKIDVRDSILSLKTFDGPAIAKYLAFNVPNQFVRREFKEFDYLPDAPTPIYAYIICILIIISSFIAPIIIDRVKNM